MTDVYPRFIVALSIMTSPDLDSNGDFMDNLLYELTMRPYLDKPLVSWDAENSRTVVRVGVEAPSPARAAGWMYDEVLESAWAVIPKVERLRVEILDVAQARDESDGA